MGNFAGYNEFVVDTEAWVEGLPQSVEAIWLLDCNDEPGGLARWLVKWVGLSSSHNSWEPQGNILAADADAIRTGDYTEVANIGGTIRAGGGAGHDGVDVGTSVGVTISNSKGAAIYGSGSGIAGSAAQASAAAS